MKELKIKGTDSYIDTLDKCLEKDYPEIRNMKRVRRINENLLRDNSLDTGDLN